MTPGSKRVLPESLAELLSERREEEERAVDEVLEAAARGRPVPGAETVGFNLPLLPSAGAEAELQAAQRTIARLACELRVANRRVERLRAVALAVTEGRQGDVASALSMLEPEDLPVSR